MAQRERRILDPTPCVIRHVRRPRAGEPSTAVLAGAFHAVDGAELEALNGEAGWQSATVSVALADDGDTVLRFPNAAGDDGILHRQRFALLTDPLYRIGEEWIEVYRGDQWRPDELVTVITARGWRMDRSTLEVKGPDLAALYGLARSSELDVWADAPRDVFEWYTRLPVALLASSLEAWSGSSPPSGSGWTAAGMTAPGATPGGRLSSSSAAPSSLAHPVVDQAAAATGWSASARIAWETPSPAGDADLRLVVTCADGSTITATYAPASGELALTGSGATMPTAGLLRTRGKTRRTMPGGAALKLLVRRRWVFAYLEGELLARARRTAYSRPVTLAVEVRNGAAVVQRADVEAPLPFGLRGADKGDLRLPGIPTPGGLRGRYWNEAAAASGYSSAQMLEAVLDPLVDPADSRLDAALNFPTGSTWQPPAAQPSNGGFSARWTGAIYLDLSGNGRRLRLNAADDGARVWVGRTLMPADAVIDAWSAGAKSDVRSANLQAALGTTSGWFPIVVEYVNTSGAGALILEESALDAGGAPTGWSVVPSTRLSPLGCYEETHRLESHRELLDAVANGYGYQWRVDPRKLESGEFPGQIIPRIRQGVDTDLILPNDAATDLSSEGDAGDAVDRLLIDAQGIADPKGAAQLTADAVNDVAIAAGHLFLTTGAESMPEVSEANLLAQRADSMLALRSGPNEQIAARPQTLEHALTDTFPLTGALGRRRWRPGDGLRLALEDLSVVDSTPRQLVALSQTLYRDGVGVPTTGWRQRPRGLRAFLQRVARATYAGQRNYQGTVGIVVGSWGIQGGPDSNSRAPLPDNLDDVIGADLIVVTLSGVGTIIVNGTNTGITVSSVGRYPIDRFIGRTGIQPRILANVTGAASYECHLELRVRI
jgi:hypothetical protein